MPSKYERELMRQGGLKRIAQKQKEEEARILASVAETSGSDDSLADYSSSYNNNSTVASKLKVKTQVESVSSIYGVGEDSSKSSSVRSTVSFGGSMSVAFNV
jgi:hypothetical protein